jgi:hypothetical protein
LIKAKEKIKRESILLDHFADAIKYLNQSLNDKDRIVYIPWDMARASKSHDQDVIRHLEKTAHKVLNMVGFFHLGKKPFVGSPSLYEM